MLFQRPPLRPLSGKRLQSLSAITADEVRFDIKASGFGGRQHEVAFFDVCLFNPHANSYQCQQVCQIYRKHEAEKRRHAGERAREVEKGTYMPLVFSATGVGPAATVFLKCLGCLIADRHDMVHGQAMGRLHCRLSKALLRASILCLWVQEDQTAQNNNRQSPLWLMQSAASAYSQLVTIII